MQMIERAAALDRDAQASEAVVADLGCAAAADLLLIVAEESVGGGNSVVKVRYCSLYGQHAARHRRQDGRTIGRPHAIQLMERDGGNLGAITLGIGSLPARTR